MKKRRILMTTLLSLTPALCPPSARTETPEEAGLAVAREADRRDSGWGDSQADMLMVLRNRHGQESVRKIRIRNLEVAGDGDKGLASFDEPADVKGTSLLTFSHKRENDDQWLYLPALKRVKRIASADKSGAFVGSEFAYEDVGSQEVEKYTYKRLPDEVLDGRDCFVLERVPTIKYSGYSRQTAWIDKEAYRFQKIEYYDRKGALLKTLVWSSYKPYLDSYWRPDEMRMVNHQNGKSTVLKWSGYSFRTGLKASDFSQENLARVR